VKMQFKSVVFSLLITLLTTSGFAQSPDPIIGTWELNVAKSTFPPDRAPKSQSRTIVQVGDEIRVTARGVRFDGVEFSNWQWSSSVHYDGKDRPMTGNPNFDLIAERRIDATTTEFTQKKEGKVVLTGRRVMSKDGKTMTITVNGRNPGDPPAAVWVFEKK
jgi:hypothetical protein